METSIKPVRITGQLYWSRWMGEFNPTFNEDNDRYECTICNISDKDVAALKTLGIKIKNKEAQGNFILAKSKFLFNPVDEEGNIVATPVKDFGNGTECVALVQSYPHKLSAKHGNAPTIKKLIVTKVKAYVPKEAEEEEEFTL